MRIIIALMLYCSFAQAYAMRCSNENGNYIIQSGNDIADVLYKCGKPDLQYEPGVLLDEEVWVYYRTDEGAVYKVKFLQGRVTDIEFDRLN